MKITASGFDTLSKRLANAADNLSKEIGVIVWSTGKVVERNIAKEVSKEIAVPQKLIKKRIKHTRLGGFDSVVSLSKSARIGLRFFKAKQTKQGVTAKISRNQPAKTYVGAFQGPKPGQMNVKWKGNAFQRRGKSRKPIAPIKGPSPWGVIVVGGKIQAVLRETDQELQRQLEKRLRYLELRKSGLLNWQQS